MKSAVAPGPLGVVDSAVIDDAILTWRSLDASHRAPVSIGTLKDASRKSAVYRLAGAGPAREDIVAKRCATATATVEHHVYTAILPYAGVRHLHCYGLAPSGGDSAWLFVEDATGTPFRAGDPAHRALAARWLATVHTSIAAPMLQGAPDRGLAYAHSVLESAIRAMRAAVDNTALDSGSANAARRALTACERLAIRWDDVAGLCAALPETLVHGGFGRKNVHVRERAAVPELLPFDWEAAGRGVPAIDLARLDPDVYSMAVRRAAPSMTPDVARRLTAVGAALWCASSIPGEADTLASPWAARVMGKIAAYADEMERALTALSWNGGRP
jgi:hypothetical protein